MASVIATYQRFREDRGYVQPRLDLSHGGNFLYMMRGREPEEYEARIMDTCLVLHAEHEFNASTFTARVVASTMSTCYCSISAAMGALFGSLHGGANEKVLEMVEEIGEPGTVGAWMDKAMAEKRKVMGMGHREYKVKDPRSYVMEEFLKELSEKKSDSRYYEILKEIEKQFRARMEEKGKPLYPNVDFFSAPCTRCSASRGSSSRRSSPWRGSPVARPHPGAAQGQPDLPSREPVPRPGAPRPWVPVDEKRPRRLSDAAAFLQTAE